MLILESQPNPLCPIPKGVPVQWVIRNTAYVVSEGTNAIITFTFSAGAGADGQTIIVAGIAFDTDSAQAYTDTTFDYSGDAESAANNFANAVRSNYNFLTWVVEVEESAGDWIVTITKSDVGVVDDFTNDATGVVPAISITDQNGTFRVTSNSRLWYQFWEGGQPVSQQERADFDRDGRAKIDAQSVSRALLGAIPPYLLWTAPRLDNNALRAVYVRFGTYEVANNCVPVFGRAYESASVDLVNAVFQHEQVRLFTPYCSRVTLPVKWMTTRSNTRTTCRTSFEWAAILMMTTPVFPGADYRYIYRYYDGDDNLISTKTITQLNREGVFRVPIGPAHEVHPTNVIPFASYYEIQVEAKNAADEYVVYSEVMRVNLSNCSCKGAEVYYLEAAGSWRTLIFDRIKTRRLNVESTQVKSQLVYNAKAGPPDGINLFVEGGIADIIESSDAPFVLRSGIVTNHNRKDYEEFLASPKYYILSASDILPAIRRFTIERGNFVTDEVGKVTRLEVICRLNTNRRIL